jgi:Fe-S cluster assembly ATP-binding protein
MGHPSYAVTGGKILLRGADITSLPADERARRGLFLGFQYPTAVPGVPVATFLRAALKSRASGGNPGAGGVAAFRKTLNEKMDALGIDRSFAARYVNDGFSGGEKKRLEVLQMAVLEPAVAILDEPDSGLDIDALKVVADGINRAAGMNQGLLLVTHYQRILGYVTPDFVHVLIHGRIVRSGGPELARTLEEKGYDPFGHAPDSPAGAPPGVDAGATK